MWLTDDSLKPAKFNFCSDQFKEGRQEDLVIYSVKDSRTDDLEATLSHSFTDWQQDSLCGMSAFEARLVVIQQDVMWKKSRKLKTMNEKLHKCL